MSYTFNRHNKDGKKSIVRRDVVISYNNLCTILPVIQHAVNFLDTEGIMHVICHPYRKTLMLRIATR